MRLNVRETLSHYERYSTGQELCKVCVRKVLPQGRGCTRESMSSLIGTNCQAFYQLETAIKDE